MLSKPKSPKVAASLAFLGVVMPISGLHKFYLGQPGWGILYVLLSWTQITRITSAVEGVWYLLQDRHTFDHNFNTGKVGETIETTATTVKPEQVSAVAVALRELDQLRQEGLISEYEFETKRRNLLDTIG